jgi:hypothetical protein
LKTMKRPETLQITHLPCSLSLGKRPTVTSNSPLASTRTLSRRPG